MTALKAPSRTLVEGDDEDQEEAYVPPLLELGRILSIARTEGVLAEQIGLAVQLTVHTAQRVLTIVSAKVAHFEEVEGVGFGLSRRHDGKPVHHGAGRPGNM